MTLLLHVALKATAIVALGWLATVTLRSASADLRRLVWRATIVAVALLPLLERVASVPIVAARTAVFTVRAGSDVLASSGPIVPLLAWVWAAGCGVMLLRLTVGVFRVHRWSRAASSEDGVRYSTHVAAPLTWGVMRPEIVLPESARDWPVEERELVLRHEQAHVDDRDVAWQVFSRIVTAALWFHPLVWLADRRLRREAERAADDRVLLAGANPVDYAAELLRVARRLSAVPTATVAMVDRSSLEERVRRVLEPGTNRRPAGRRVVLAVSAAVIALSASTAALQNGPVYQVGDEGVTPPRLTRNVQPRYSQSAKDAGIQGTVLLRLTVNPSGEPEGIRVVRYLEDSLDRNAVDAVSQWRFEPGRKDGKPVRVDVEIEIRYTLK